MQLCVLSHSVVSDSATHGLKPNRLLCPWDSSGQNTGMGCHAFLQVTFATQELNLCFLCLLHCGWILYHWTTVEATFIIGNHVKLTEQNKNGTKNSHVPITQRYYSSFAISPNNVLHRKRLHLGSCVATSFVSSLENRSSAPPWLSGHLTFQKVTGQLFCRLPQLGLVWCVFTVTWRLCILGRNHTEWCVMLYPLDWNLLICPMPGSSLTRVR